MTRTLLIGYGNRDRTDDGVAYHVVAALRGRLGQVPLGEYETGLEALGTETDCIFLPQLVPELLDVAHDYDQIVFVDAHTYEDRGLRCALVQPEDTSLVYAHDVSPANLLLMLRTLHHRQPSGYVVSVRAHDLRFGRGLSPGTEALVEQAVDRILHLLAGGDRPSC